MKCKNCGHENEAGKKVCSACGEKLTEDKPRKKKEKNEDRIEMNDIRSSRKRRSSSKDPDLMTFGLIFGAILIFALIAIIFSYFTGLGSNDKTPKEDTKVEESADQTKDEDSNKEELYQKALKASRDAIENGEYISAAKLLDAIPESAGSYYDEAQKEIEKLEAEVVKAIEASIAEEDYESAEKLASDYLKLFPDSKKVEDLNKEAKKALGQDTEEDEDSEKENTAEEETTSQSPNQTRANLSQADLERLRVNNSYGQNGNPSYTEVYNESDFLNKNVTVDAHLGEIRTEPNLNSGVAGYVNDGETVYVQEVYNDGGRYWLNIGNGWISSKLITGEFSQR